MYDGSKDPLRGDPDGVFLVTSLLSTRHLILSLQILLVTLNTIASRNTSWTVNTQPDSSSNDGRPAGFKGLLLRVRGA